MAADYPPFMNAYGNIPKILDKIKQAETPSRFTQDFLEKTLSFPGGSRRPFIPLAKRMGFIGSDGVPTELYKRFQNPDRSKSAMAEAIRKGYPTLFERNQQAYKLDKKGLEGLVREATGLDANSGTLKSIVGTFEALKHYADFSAPGQSPDHEDDQHDGSKPPAGGGGALKQGEVSFSYTIYVNLPNTTEIAVFNAIFKSLRDNILTS
jgi:Family of unknown function (DUF5343)